MREAAIYPGKKAFLTLCCLLFAAQAKAVPPEGLEAYSLTDGKAGSNYIYSQAGYVNPSWSSDYETIQAYVSLATKSGNYFTYGGSLTAGNVLADRDAYFGRFDWTFYGQSLSLKLAHQDLRYIPAGKNIGTFAYNAAFHVGAATAFYSSVGIYYRYNLNSWNTPTWSPTNFNTDDRDSFLELCFGARIKVGQSHYVTVDLNNRDPFIPYNGDNLALDVTLNIISTPAMTWRLTSSSRFSGLLVGTADLSEETFLAGFITGF